MKVFGKIRPIHFIITFLVTLILSVLFALFVFAISIQIWSPDNHLITAGPVIVALLCAGILTQIVLHNYKRSNMKQNIPEKARSFIFTSGLSLLIYLFALSIPLTGVIKGLIPLKPDDHMVTITKGDKTITVNRSKVDSVVVSETRKFLRASDTLFDKSSVVETRYPSGKIRFMMTVLEGTTEKPIKVLQRIYYESGELFKAGICINGSEEGEWKYYFKNGKVSSRGLWKAGKKEGKFYRYYETGEVEQNGRCVNNKVVENRLFYRNGTPKPESLDLSPLFKSKVEPWALCQLDKIKSRFKQEFQWDYSSYDSFCDCIIDSISKHVEFKALDTLSDFDRRFIVNPLMAKGYCKGLLIAK